MTAHSILTPSIASIDRQCDLCETKLEFTLSDGQRMKFTAHSAQFCKSITLSRIRRLEAIIKEVLLEKQLAIQELRELRMAPSTDLERDLESVRRIANVTKDYGQDKDC